MYLDALVCLQVYSNICGSSFEVFASVSVRNGRMDRILGEKYGRGVEIEYPGRTAYSWHRKRVPSLVLFCSKQPLAPFPCQPGSLLGQANGLTF